MKTKIKKWITFLFLASMLTIAYVTPAKAQYLPDEYTVGLWHLDKEFGTALSFDGIDDYVAVPDSIILEPANVTAEAWVKRLGSPGTYKYILSKHYGSSWNSYGLYTGTTGGLKFYIGTVSGFYPSPDPGAGIWDGSWHHIAGTFDGSYVRLYVDGIEVGTGTGVPLGTTIAYNGAGLNIGGPGDPWLGVSYHFGGGIDEVRISKVARTSFELLTPPTVDSDTVALWHFDEGFGQSVYDATDNGNDGQLGSTSDNDDNDPSWVDSPLATTLAIDSSSNENHGTIYGATFVDGEFEQALQFDGIDDYVNIPDDPSLDISGDITLEAWFKITDFTSNPHMHILAKDNIGQRSYTIGVNCWWSSGGAVPQKPFFVVFTTSDVKVVFGTTTPQLDTWYHLMGVYTAFADELKLYLNGELESSVTSGPSSINVSDADLQIGARQYPPVPSYNWRCFFNGAIDEVRISNVAREPGIAVNIDIKPGSDPNSICLSKQGLLPVAILSADNFDATHIDPSTLELGGIQVSERGGGAKKTPKIAYSIEDVDGDGDLDMIAFFSVFGLVDSGGLTSTTGSLELTGNLTNGTPIVGIDSVRIVPE